MDMRRVVSNASIAIVAVGLLFAAIVHLANPSRPSTASGQETAAEAEDHKPFHPSEESPDPMSHPGDQLDGVPDEEHTSDLGDWSAVVPGDEVGPGPTTYDPAVGEPWTGAPVPPDHTPTSPGVAPPPPPPSQTQTQTQTQPQPQSPSRPAPPPSSPPGSRIPPPSPVRAVEIDTTCGTLSVGAPDRDGWRNNTWLQHGRQQMNVLGLGWNPAGSIGVKVGADAFWVAVSCSGQPALERAETYAITRCGVLRISDPPTPGWRRVSWVADRQGRSTMNLAGLGWNPSDAIDIGAGGSTFTLSVQCAETQTVTVR